ncbi:TlpA family protein disulfide reductase [Candidatus Sumerlaeota bacterium]|nr:TlpA family protein disulfide reductase [Candidatus Sumerlaeota bacterium]
MKKRLVLISSALLLAVIMAVYAAETQKGPVEQKAVPMGMVMPGQAGNNLANFPETPPLFIKFGEIGDPAGKLGKLEWVQKRVDFKPGEDGTIYVVEFWATWCVPCRYSAPHLTELQKKYQDQNVKIIGISAGEDSDTVWRFVRKMGKYMDYSVAVDTVGTAYWNYQLKYNAEGIPQAYLIDENGKVIWVDHPGRLDEPLERAVKLRDARALERTKANTVQESSGHSAENAGGTDRAELNQE